MVNRLRDFIVSVIASLLATVLWQIFIALWPVLLALILIVIGKVSSLLVAAILAVGWSLSSLAGIVWFKNHTKRRAERMIELATILSVGDHTLNTFIVNKLGNLTAPDVREEITSILSGMCDVLAYRLNSRLKGAALLINEDDHFELYACVRHHTSQLSHKIKTMPMEGSLAGQALEEQRCIVLRDSRKPEANIRWKPLSPPSQFIGRAVAPVQVIVGDLSGNSSVKDIGVVCFDVMRPWDLSEEDKKIMAAVADKIAAIWILFQP